MGKLPTSVPPPLKRVTRVKVFGNNLEVFIELVDSLSIPPPISGDKLKGFRTGSISASTIRVCDCVPIWSRLETSTGIMFLVVLVQLGFRFVEVQKKVSSHPLYQLRYWVLSQEIWWKVWGEWLVQCLGYCIDWRISRLRLAVGD